MSLNLELTVPARPSGMRVPAPPHLAFSSGYTTTPGFFSPEYARDSAGVLMLVQQRLYPLSHLPSPQTQRFILRLPWASPASALGWQVSPGQLTSPSVTRSYYHKNLPQPSTHTAADLCSQPFPFLLPAIYHGHLPKVLHSLLRLAMKEEPSG